MRVNIPDFDRDTLNPEGFIDWLVAVEEVFEFKERALAFEKQNRRVGSSSSPAITGISGSGNAVSRFAPNQAKAGGGNTRPVPKATGRSGLKCFNCGEPGYRQSECKKAGKRHLFADPEDNDDDVAYGDYEAAPIYDDEPEFEEEYVFGDVGLNLVVRRSCLTPKADGDDWLKHNIFQSTCTIMGKVCTFVCDSGSCDNLIAEEAVQKLGLKTENRPKPYKLQWLKNGGEVTVSKRVHVSFSITLMPNKPKEVVNKPTGTLLTLSQFEDELEIMEKMYLNAYRLKLLSHIRCSDVFNVKHLLPYHGNSSDEDNVGNSRTNFVYPGGNDENPRVFLSCRMYPSRGNNNAYGQQQQQQQHEQSSYGQTLGSEGGSSQLSMSARHAAMLSNHPSAAAQYGGQYSSVYGSVGLNSALQAPGASAKGSGSSALEGRSGYGSTMQESPKYAHGDYAATQKYGQKGDLSGYSPVDRRQYIERPDVYAIRESQNEPNARFADSIAFSHHQQQADIYDRLDATTALRKELLQAQTLQSSSIEGSSRQADFLARAATVRHTGQELLSYGGRMEPDPNTLSMISGLSHRAQHAPSILGAAPRLDVDDLVYTHTSVNPGYGVSLPPGRDYGSSAILARTGYSRVDDPKGRDEERERERRRDLLRDREKERERERERERQRERERKRERERDREHREKERDKEKRVTGIKRERSPPRISKDRGGSLSTKAEKSPRVEASHRRRSPIKAKRRDYICKVYSSSLVDAERDYLSIDKRYPRLFTSPECSKVVVNWARDNLEIPLNVPVSFEHDFVQDDAQPQHKEVSTATMVDDSVKSEHGSTIWNGKMILMSGLSRNALEELSSERDYDDRIPHFCNMLRFACLKDGNSLIAIGGLWETTDGNDPSADKSALVQTSVRHAKNLTGLDLKNCQHWSPFLEIHYDRVGKDGLFSHKEVTVLYIPDLSDCLPSLDAWRDQWLAHKKAVAERERLHALKKEISREKKKGLKDKEPGTPKDLKKDVKPVKKKATGSASKPSEKTKGKAKETGKEDVLNSAETKKKDESNDAGKKDQAEVTAVPKTSVKKKIIRRVVKKKVVAKDKLPESAAEQGDVLDSKKEEVTPATTNNEAAGQNEESTGTPSSSKTSTKKKVIKKVPVVKTVTKDDEGAQSEVTPVKEQQSSEIKPKSASGKTIVKKKIVKRVVKRKVVANKDKVAEEGVTIATQSGVGGNQENEVKLESNESVPKASSPSVVPEPSTDAGSLEPENKKAKVESGPSSKTKTNNGNNKKLKDGEKSKEGKVKKEEDVKAESKGKEIKEKIKDDDIPRHPGLFLQTKGNKNSKLRSLSLSLDSLLDYDDNDVEESTFELSLFAETFYEMLQYQMGSRILTFLKKLRIQFVAKRNQKKRQLEESSGKEKVKPSAKRVKTDKAKVFKSVTVETVEEAPAEDEKTKAKVENMDTENAENAKPEGYDQDEDPEEDPDEDPEEDPEEDEDMVDASPNDNTENEEKAAFRFFDRNRVGHIRVEDMRLIIHNLGNFLSHRDVKDLVQSALLESNTGRDDRILYNRLVSMDV
nr:cell division cycle and apoptosis regulator protein 1-like isoform X1 [Tanacetum cinerariifolium]